MFRKILVLIVASSGLGILVILSRLVMFQGPPDLHSGIGIIISFPILIIIFITAGSFFVGRWVSDAVDSFKKPTSISETQSTLQVSMAKISAKLVLLLAVLFVLLMILFIVW